MERVVILVKKKKKKKRVCGCVGEWVCVGGCVCVLVWVCVWVGVCVCWCGCMVEEVFWLRTVKKKKKTFFWKIEREQLFLRLKKFIKSLVFKTFFFCSEISLSSRKTAMTSLSLSSSEQFQMDL